jgi:hypothetical protein
MIFQRLLGLHFSACGDDLNKYILTSVSLFCTYQCGDINGCQICVLYKQKDYKIVCSFLNDCVKTPGTFLIPSCSQFQGGSRGDEEGRF